MVLSRRAKIVYCWDIIHLHHIYYVELGVVGVTDALEHGFVEFPCSEVAVTETDTAGRGGTRRTYPGCAGNYPMIVGGDPFDLASLGNRRPEKVRYILVRDTGHNDRGAQGDTAGFDLDSIFPLGQICEEEHNTGGFQL